MELSPSFFRVLDPKQHSTARVGRTLRRTDPPERPLGGHSRTTTTKTPVPASFVHSSKPLGRLAKSPWKASSLKIISKPIQARIGPDGEDTSAIANASATLV